MELNKLKLPTMPSNFIIWIIIAFLVFGFGKPASVLGINFFNPPNVTPGPEHRSSHKHYNENKQGIPRPAAAAAIPAPPLGGLGGIGTLFGGNLLFIIAIIVFLFIYKEEKKEEEECNNDNGNETVSYDEVIEG